MTIRRVPTDYADIAAANAVAVSGDEIVLEQIGSPFQGFNNRGIVPSTTGLIFRGETGDARDIEIDCQNGDRAFNLGGAFHDTQIRDLTIRNGQQNTAGGILISNLCFRPILSNLIFRDCVAAGRAGAIELVAAVPGAVIEHCICYRCVASAGRGGGVYHGGGLSTLKNLLMIECEANGAVNQGQGGALCVSSADSSTYENISAVNCTTTQEGGGFAIVSANLAYNFFDCLAWGNVAGTQGNQFFGVVASLVNLDYCSAPQGANDIVLGAGSTITNHLNVDPLLATIGADPVDIAYLSQIAAGQGADSPCVNSGSTTAAARGLDTRTTRTDGTPDSGQLDRGFHYFSTGGPAPMPSFTTSQKERGCYNCDHFQPYGEEGSGAINQYGECRAHPPLDCCSVAIEPAFNNWPQIDQSMGGAPGWWCDEWKRTTGTPAPYTPAPPPP